MTEEQRVEKTISNLDDTVTGPTDFLGESKPSILFYPMVKLLRPLLSCNPDRMISEASIRIRRLLHPVLLALLGIDAPDAPVKLTNEPVIWCPNHGF